jgi:hypothetical protein
MKKGIPVPEQFACFDRSDRKRESYHFKELGQLLYDEADRRTLGLPEELQKDILQLKRDHLLPETGK